MTDKCKCGNPFGVMAFYVDSGRLCDDCYCAMLATLNTPDLEVEERIRENQATPDPEEAWP